MSVELNVGGRRASQVLGKRSKTGSVSPANLCRLLNREQTLSHGGSFLFDEHGAKG